MRRRASQRLGQLVRDDNVRRLCDVDAMGQRGSDQIDVDRAAERVEPMRTVLSHDALAGRDARAIDETMQRAECLNRSIDRLLHLRFVRDVRNDKSCVTAER